MPRKSDFIEQIDKLVGHRIHELRLCMGFPRQKLASQIGITHQQLQKYETGTNRISVGRLSFIAKALKKPIGYFLETIGNEDVEETIPAYHRRMCIEVGRNFMKISNYDHQIAINNLVKALAIEEQKDD